MAPQLVVAGAPYKVYPGGVIALRATDWLGNSGATTESNALAIEGEVVRETQTTASNIRTAQVAAFQSLQDTLEIDLSGIPEIEAPFRYDAFVSLLIEGDWHPSVDESSRGSDQASFAFTCIAGLFGDDLNTSDSDYALLSLYPRNRPHFTTMRFVGRLEFSDGSETLHIRFGSRSDSTIEFLIDQILLIPIITSTTGTWTPSDFKVIGGAAQDFGVLSPIDGPDGGDVNGKFTWHPYSDSFENYLASYTGADGGGDYQKEDSEYLLRVDPDDSYFLVDSTGTLDSPGLAHAYSLHGANYRDDTPWLEDSFTRSDAGTGWDATPEGFMWAVTDPGTVFLNGTQGVMHYDGAGVEEKADLLGSTIFPTPNGQFGAAIQAENLYIAGQFIVDQGGGTPFVGSVHPTVVIDLVESGSRTVGYALVVQMNEQNWALWRVVSSVPVVKISSDVDISSWFSPEPQSVATGFRFEIRRQRLRARVWEVSGGEPSTWGVDMFRPIPSTWSGSPTWRDYPYSDDPQWAIKGQVAFMPRLEIKGPAISQWDTFWDAIVVGSDPGGEPEDVAALMEQPEGTEVARLTIPYGAWPLVHWGSGIWTDLDSFSDCCYLNFSSKVWSDAGAPELQRCEAPFYYFRSARLVLVSMNWRSGDRQTNVHRIHVGEG